MAAAHPNKLQYVTLDVFTDTRYEGNPLAIVKVPRSVSLSQEQKQLLAREFNYSETVILHEQDETEDATGLPHWQLGIFLKDREINWAGHPTIGTACHCLAPLASPAATAGDTATRGTFTCRAGRIDLRYAQGKAFAMVPHDAHIHEHRVTQDEILKIQPKLEVTDLGAPLFTTCSIVNGMAFTLVELSSLEALSKVEVTTHRLTGELDPGWQGGFHGTYYFVIVESRDAPQPHMELRTRMLETNLEDPATGSAASALTAYLTLKFIPDPTQARPAISTYTVTQGVEMGRRSVMNLEVALDADDQSKIQTICLSGSAVQVMEGELLV